MPNLTRKEEYRKYLSSTQWRTLRELVLERDGHACKKCCSPKSLQVHHLTYDRIFQEQLDDLITLCDRCHRAEHPKPKKKPSRRKRQRLKHLKGLKAKRRPEKIRGYRPANQKKRPNQKLIDLNDELHLKQKRAREKRLRRVA